MARRQATTPAGESLNGPRAVDFAGEQIGREATPELVEIQVGDNRLPALAASIAAAHKAHRASAQAFEITLFKKSDGPLTKTIRLDGDKPVSDGRDCRMWRGVMMRRRLCGLHELPRLIEGLKNNEAIALGSMREGLASPAPVNTKKKAKAGEATRSLDNIGYRDGEPTLQLIDYDNKGMTPEVRARLDAHGGFLAALASLIADFERIGTITRLSTSAGLVNADTGEEYEGSGGLHLYLVIADGGDAKRFLYCLHDLAWLHGLGWFIVGKSGKLLERSIVDRCVYSPERLIFEAAPKLEKPLRQKPRRATVHDGATLDSRTVQISPADKAEAERIKAAARKPFAEQCANVRKQFVAERIARGMSPSAAEHWADGVLLPDVPLEFLNPELAGAKVADVFADPDRYIGQALADPLEGIGYGNATAKVFRRHDTGEIYIRSFAHSGCDYSLRHDFQSIAVAIDNADKSKVLKLFCDLAVIGVIDPAEMDQLIKKIVAKCGVGVRIVKQMLDQARRSKRQKEAEAQRETQTEKSGKTMLPAPAPDAEIGPIMRDVDDIMCSIEALEPPMRDLFGRPVYVVEREPFGGLHELTAEGANDDETETSRLPPPKLALMTRHDVYSAELQFGDTITFFRQTKNGGYAEVCPQRRALEHYLRYTASRMPRIGACLTMPLVLPDGSLLTQNGLDRNHRLVMRCDSKLLSFISRAADGESIRAAFKFLTDEWLCDVAADIPAKCVLIAICLSIIERALFKERPIFLLTAGQRSSGKTTTLRMLIYAVLGISPVAAAWADNEEERRKAMFAYLLEALPSIVWDNIQEGSLIESRTLNQICTEDVHNDRVLKETHTEAAPAFTIMTFTGNNISAAGDLASRSLTARLLVDQSDPQNRTFKHIDPIQWTIDHRGQILNALYTILLANPQFDAARRTTPKTRFKMWWNMIACPIEHAAASCGHTVDFAALFDVADVADEKSIEIANVLDTLRGSIYFANKKEFTSSDLSEKLREMSMKASSTGITDPPDLLTLKNFINKGNLARPITAIGIGIRLGSIIDQPKEFGDVELTLKARVESHQKHFHVRERPKGKLDL